MMAGAAIPCGLYLGTGGNSLPVIRPGLQHQAKQCQKQKEILFHRNDHNSMQGNVFYQYIMKRLPRSQLVFYLSKQCIEILYALRLGKT
jgi:hypothetical protein